MAPAGPRPTLAVIVALSVALLALVALIEAGALTYAYQRLGLDRRAAYALLTASIAGSFLDIPVARWPARHERIDLLVDVAGWRYRLPSVVRTDETVLAVNVGGAGIPTVTSAYLFVHTPGWQPVAATVFVAIVVHRFARVVPAVGVVVPLFVPAFAAGIAAIVLGGHPSETAYISGTLGALVGADLWNLPHVRQLGGRSSIGGAGTLDGIALSGLLAVVLASL